MLVHEQPALKPWFAAQGWKEGAGGWCYQGPRRKSQQRQQQQQEQQEQEQQEDEDGAASSGADEAQDEDGGEAGAPDGVRFSVDECFRERRDWADIAAKLTEFLKRRGRVELDSGGPGAGLVLELGGDYAVGWNTKYVVPRT
jgi:hypothetical protein